MKNSARKKHLSEQAVKAKKLPVQFVRDTLRAKAEAGAGKLKPYQFNGVDRAVAGLPELDALRYLDSQESITAYLTDIIENNDANLLEAALSTMSPLIPRAADPARSSQRGRASAGARSSKARDRNPC